MDKYLSKLSISDFYAQSHCDRYHTEAVTRRQFLSEHSHRVAFIAVKMLYDYVAWLKKKAAGLEGGLADLKDFFEDGDVDRLELAIHRYAMIHDIVETEGSDVPTHVKRYLRESRGVDLNPIMHRMFWKSRGIEEDSYDVPPLVEALVSLADTLEGKVFARYNIPRGAVQTQVMADWNVAWTGKLEKFSKAVEPAFLYDVLAHDYYANDLSVDPAWA